MQERRLLKMRTRILILMFLLGVGTKSICQNQICYNVYNNSDSDIVSWINFDNNSDRDSNYLIRDHFHKRIHDFSLTDMFWQIENYKYDDLTPHLLVLIPAKSKFTYYVNKESYKKGCYIVTYYRKDVEATLGYYLEERWMYKGKNIYVINNNRCIPNESHKRARAYFTIVIN